MVDTTRFQQSMRRVEELVHGVEALEDAVTRENTLELIRALMELHSAGLERMFELLDDGGEAGRGFIASFAADELTASLLLMHDLHPDDLETRVGRALDSIRPYLAMHGGGVDLVAVALDAVTVRLGGSCNGCGASSDTLRGVVEDAILAAAPEILVVRSDSPQSPAAALVQIGVGRRGAASQLGVAVAEGGRADG